MEAPGKTNLMPLRHRFGRRFGQLQVGLLVYGMSLALLVRAHLGLDPWDVFQQGISRRTGLSFGTVVCAVGALVLLLWIPLRQRPGLGTISNVVVIGIAADLSLLVVPDAQEWWLRGALMVAGVLLNAAATGMYLGARLGPGPRDGLMTGLSERFAWLSIRVARTSIELTVLAAGFLLGGTVGIATVVYAFGIGPLTQLFLPLFALRDPQPAALPAPA